MNIVNLLQIILRLCGSLKFQLILIKQIIDSTQKRDL